MTKVLISMGSNIDKEINLPAAIALLQTNPKIMVLAVSPVLVTSALGADGQPANQPSFHNAGVLADTTLTPQQLRQLLRQIEAELGRVRSPDKFAPRPIDLDLAFYGDTVLTPSSGDGQQLPDPDVLRFAHVAMPLAAVAPDWVHPLTGTTLASIAATFADAHQRAP